MKVRGPFFMVRFALLFTCLVGLVGLSGCGGDGINRQPVSGSLTFNNAPIKYGSIRFEPAEKQVTTASGSIKEGRYEIKRDAGLSPGKYKVWVQAFDRSGETPAGAMPGSEGPPPRDILPQKYLTQPAAEITIKPVSDTEPNNVSLDLK